MKLTPNDSWISRAIRWSSSDAPLNLLALFIVLLLMLFVAASLFSCLFFLIYCVWHFFEDGWQPIAFICGIVVLGSLTSWAFNRLRKWKLLP